CARREGIPDGYYPSWYFDVW
nr:immunoglobulin heavy chain junction region [Mus musculus]MBK4195803.1 immunoglobulin heavy chain junction region [Mus musculus]MBK4195804.1 immunoglobulin heavy chain junction region [Mus musculus]MBK4195806.1 immunoglobulin heavy chain junction region [Mus musculus]